jgi:TPR repeat protein
VLYERGIGVPRDHGESARWMARAQQHGVLSAFAP